MISPITGSKKINFWYLLRSGNVCKNAYRRAKSSERIWDFVIAWFYLLKRYNPSKYGIIYYTHSQTMTREYFIQRLADMPPLALGLLLLYLLPTWLALANRSKDVLAIFVLNVLGGWTVIGYAVLIVRATKRKEVWF